MMVLLSKKIDSFNKKIGEGLSWLNLALALLMFLIVIFRYLFNLSWVWMQELATLFHGTLFLLCISYGLVEDSHVRVDLIYKNSSEKFKNGSQIFGVLFFLWPLAFLILFKSFSYVLDSWRVLEASGDAGGLPGLFLFKSLIPLSAILVFFQGLSMLLKSLSFFMSKGRN